MDRDTYEFFQQRLVVWVTSTAAQQADLETCVNRDRIQHDYSYQEALDWIERRRAQIHRERSASLDHARQAQVEFWAVSDTALEALDTLADQYRECKEVENG